MPTADGAECFLGSNQFTGPAWPRRVRPPALAARPSNDRPASLPYQPATFCSRLPPVQRGRPRPKPSVPFHSWLAAMAPWIRIAHIHMHATGLDLARGGLPRAPRHRTRTSPSPPKITSTPAGRFRKQNQLYQVTRSRRQSPSAALATLWLVP